MKIVCESCSAKHELDPPAWVVSSGRPFRFRCSTCGHSQMAEPPTGIALTDEVEAQVAEQGKVASAQPLSAGQTIAPAEEIEDADGDDAKGPRSEATGSGSVFLKQDGKVYLVKDWATLQRWIMERRVGREDLVSEGGVRWEPIGSRPELGSFFAAVEQIEAAELGVVAPSQTPTLPDPHTPETPFPVGPTTIGGETPFPSGPVATGVGATPFPTPAPAPSMASGGGFPLYDDQTEGIPTGLPPLPTEEVGGPSEESETEQLPPSRLSMPSPAPAPVLEPTPTPAPEPEPVVVPQAPTLPFISPSPSFGGIDNPTPRVEPEEEEEEAAMAFADDDSEEIPREDTDFPVEDPFKDFGPTDTTTVDPDGWEDRTGGLPIGMIAAVVLVAAIVLGLGWWFTLGPGASTPTADTQLVAPGTDGEPEDTRVESKAGVDTDAGTEGTDVDAKDTDAADTDAADTDADAADTDADAADTDAADADAKDAPPVEQPEPAKAPAASGPSFKTLTNRAWGQLDGGDFSAAQRTFDRALELRPNDPDANYGYGYALLQQGKAAQAGPYLCRALRNAGGDKTIERDVSGLLNSNGLSCP